MAGQADDLGGGVFKKRLHDNDYRSIIVAKGGDYWVYEYLFAKQDRANIDAAELKAFRHLAKAYAGLTAAQVEALLPPGAGSRFAGRPGSRRPHHEQEKLQERRL